MNHSRIKKKGITLLLLKKIKIATKIPIITRGYNGIYNTPNNLKGINPKSKDKPKRKPNKGLSKPKNVLIMLIIVPNI